MARGKWPGVMGCDPVRSMSWFSCGCRSYFHAQFPSSNLQCEPRGGNTDPCESCWLLSSVFCFCLSISVVPIFQSCVMIWSQRTIIRTPSVETDPCESFWLLCSVFNLFIFSWCPFCNCLCPSGAKGQLYEPRGGNPTPAGLSG